MKKLLALLALLAVSLAGQPAAVPAPADPRIAQLEKFAQLAVAQRDATTRDLLNLQIQFELLRAGNERLKTQVESFAALPSKAAESPKPEAPKPATPLPKK
jgi:hypothetical protein